MGLNLILKKFYIQQLAPKQITNKGAYMYVRGPDQNLREITNNGIITESKR